MLLLNIQRVKLPNHLASKCDYGQLLGNWLWEEVTEIISRLRYDPLFFYHNKHWWHCMLKWQKLKIKAAWITESPSSVLVVLWNCLALPDTLCDMGILYCSSITYAILSDTDREMGTSFVACKMSWMTGIRVEWAWGSSQKLDHTGFVNWGKEFLLYSKYERK